MIGFSQQDFQPMRYELTLCNVARLGAASGFETIIQLNRFLISALFVVG
jgi:hypothetical protein